MPDALSKTIPIWCAVINRFLFPEAIGYYDLQTPREVIGRSEDAQISTRIPGFLDDVKVAKPARPGFSLQDQG